MEVRAIRLQQPAVGDVANQHVVEAPDRLVADVGTARLGELEPTQSVEGRLALLPLRCPASARTAPSEKSVPTTEAISSTRRSRGVEPLQPGRQKRVDRRRDGDGVDVDREPPAGRARRRGPRRATSIPISSRTNRGLPPVDDGRRRRSSSGSRAAPSTLGGELGGRPGVEAAEVDRLGYPPADGDQVGPDSRGARAGRGPARGPVPPAPTRRGARRSRAAACRPTGCRRATIRQRPVARQHLDEPA